MRGIVKAALAAAMVASAAPALAQEVVVTGIRSQLQNGVVDAISAEDIGSLSDNDSGAPAPVLMLRRTADFAVQQVVIAGDTRDETRRRDEMLAMVQGAIGLAGKFGVQLATGQLVIEPLTLANYRNLPIGRQGGREDAEQIFFLVKTPLAPGVDAKTALDRISKFIAAVPTVGRAEMRASSTLTLSVVDPEQYRGAIIDLIARDTGATAGRFGPGYGVNVNGLDRPVQWNRASLTEVSLYLPVTYVVRPKD